MGTQNNLVAKAVRYALATGMAATFVAAPAFAADEKKNDDEKIVITGSRIKRVDVEGPSPITVIDRADIDASGDNSIADVLRSSTFNSFGSFRERSGVGNGATGNAGISLRGLGSSRSLVLIDGKRAPSSPSTGGGGSQNINLLPIAAVERIEILRDGASAIYGSDAIAGVINIILRKDFDGLVASVGAERPTQEGADQSSFSITGGVTSGKGNITYVIDHSERKELLNADRDFTSIGLSSFGFPGTYWAYDHATGAYEGVFRDSRCPVNLGDSAEFPNSFQNGNGTCGFNYAAVSASSAAIDRSTLFVNANYEISDNITFVNRTTISKVHGQGRYAPAPVTSFPTIAFDNPINPRPGADLSIAFRNVPGGNRDTNTEDLMIDVLVGLEGSNDWMGGTDWRVNVHHSASNNEALQAGMGFTSALQTALDDASFDLFGVRGDSAETVNAIAQTFGHLAVFKAKTTEYSVDGDISFDLFQMPAGAVPVVLGFEYSDLNFFQVNDPQSNSGNVFGTSGGANVKAGRYRKSAYVEMVVPVLENLEADIALRYDSYADFGNTVNPKISLGYRPTDEILVRASYGEGFRAPTMGNLYTQASQSFDSAIDVLACSQFVAGGGSVLAGPCKSTQYETRNSGNQNLDAETSKSLTLGVVYNPVQDLSMSFTYYDIKLNGSIGAPSLQGIMNNDARLRNSGGAGDPRVTRNANGKFLIADTTISNGTSFKTTGYDIDTEYKLDAGNIGEFNFGLIASFVDSFDSIDSLGVKSDIGVGEFQSTSSGQPDYRAQFSASWSRGDWAANLQVQYTPAMDFVAQGIDPTTGDLTEPVTTKNAISSWTTIDTQVVYNTPWNGKLTVGARNITNEDPPLNTNNLSSPFYLTQIHDIFGRVPYIRYEQSF